MAEKQVLFLCTGNSARSQMAEGLVNHFLGERWQAHSAGTVPTGRVHPLAIRVMSELEIDISGHRSKSVDEFINAEFDLVMTVCDDAAENCPIWLGSGPVVHMSFPDPAGVNGDEAARLAVFTRVRDEIGDKILNYLAENE